VGVAGVKIKQPHQKRMTRIADNTQHGKHDMIPWRSINIKQQRLWPST